MGESKLSFDQSAEIEALKAENAALKAENQALRAENQALKERLQQIEERLGLNSKNSSKPPSSDTNKKSRLGSLKNRSRGGQSGHKGHHREQWPEDQAEVIACPPQETCSCGGNVVITGKPYIHESFELPEIQPLVRHYHIQYGRCQSCHLTHTGSLPEGVPSGLLGPRLLALSGMLSSQYHLSKAKICQLYRDILGFRISAGTLSKQEKLLSEALSYSYDEVHAILKKSAVLNMDETGFKQNNGDAQNPEGKKAWVWVMMNESLTLYKIELGRGQKQAEELLGSDFQGIVCSDRYSAYNILDQEQHAYCWAHLLRDFERIAERPGECGQIGKALVEHSQQLFWDWSRYSAGELKVSTFRSYMRGLRRNILDLLNAGAEYSKSKGEKSLRAKTAALCRNLLKIEPCLWTFVEQDIEPSNNRAERALRIFVTWRKVCYGTQSERGSRLMERLFTAVSSCRLQQRNVLQFLTQTVQAHLGLGIKPSLVSGVGL